MLLISPPQFITFKTVIWGLRILGHVFTIENSESYRLKYLLILKDFSRDTASMLYTEALASNL